MFQLCKVSIIAIIQGLLYSANKVRGPYNKRRCAGILVFNLLGSLPLSWNTAAVSKCKERANNGADDCHDDDYGDDDDNYDDNNLYDL